MGLAFNPSFELFLSGLIKSLKTQMLQNIVAMFARGLFSIRYLNRH